MGSKHKIKRASLKIKTTREVHVHKKPKKEYSRREILDMDMDNYLKNRRKLEKRGQFYRDLINTIKHKKNRFKQSLTDFILVKPKPEENYGDGPSVEIVHKEHWKFLKKILIRFKHLFLPKEEEFDMSEEEIRVAIEKERLENSDKEKYSDPILRTKKLPDVDEPLDKEFSEPHKIKKEHYNKFKKVINTHKKKKKEKEFEECIAPANDTQNDTFIEKAPDEDIFDDEIEDYEAPKKRGKLLDGIRKWIKKRDDNDKEVEKMLDKESNNTKNPKKSDIKRYNTPRSKISSKRVDKDLEDLEDIGKEVDAVEKRMQSRSKKS